jgi:hypothetical protein
MPGIEAVKVEFEVCVPSRPNAKKFGPRITVGCWPLAEERRHDRELALAEATVHRTVGEYCTWFMFNLNISIH